MDRWEALFKALPRQRKNLAVVGVELLRLDLGTAIRALRKRQGVTLLNLAARTGLSLNKVTLMENELTNFELGTLVRVAHALGSSLEVRFLPSNGNHGPLSQRAMNHARKLSEVPLKKANRRVIEDTAKRDEMASIVSEGLVRLSINEALHTMRKKAGLTQKHLAARSGFSSSKISNAEDGPRNLMLATLIRITRGLGRQVHISFVPNHSQEDSRPN